MLRVDKLVKNAIRNKKIFTLGGTKIWGPGFFYFFENFFSCVLLDYGIGGGSVLFLTGGTKKNFYPNLGVGKKIFPTLIYEGAKILTFGPTYCFFSFNF